MVLYSVHTLYPMLYLYLVIKWLELYVMKWQESSELLKNLYWCLFFKVLQSCQKLHNSRCCHLLFKGVTHYYSQSQNHPPYFAQFQVNFFIFVPLFTWNRVQIDWKNTCFLVFWVGPYTFTKAPLLSTFKEHK